LARISRKTFGSVFAVIYRRGCAKFPRMSERPFHIVLYQPVIPQNTGSIARLCACTGAVLHLIHPLGFLVDEASVKRAGLDYWPHVAIREHANWEEFQKTEQPEAIYFFSKFSTRYYTEVKFPPGAYLVFGSETKGLPDSFHKAYSDHFYKIPMRTHLVRSLNLSQAAAIVLYEGLRQTGFDPQ
jgi:tRNA (cytidine/uridine-2'-O-)-methyltransferase